MLNGKYQIFLEIDTRIKNLKHGASFCSYHMLMRQTFDPIWSKLSQLPIRLEILGDLLRDVLLYTGMYVSLVRSGYDT